MNVWHRHKEIKMKHTSNIDCCTVNYKCPSVFALKVPITTAADNILKYFFNFSMKTSLDISCESCQADDSHEISRLVFFEKLKK